MNLAWRSFIFVVIVSVFVVIGLIIKSFWSCLTIGVAVAVLATVPPAWNAVRGNAGAQRAAGIVIGIVAAIVLFNATVGFWSPEFKGTWNDMSVEYKHDLSVWFRDFVKGGYKSTPTTKVTTQVPATVVQPAPVVVQQPAPAPQTVVVQQPCPQPPVVVQPAPQVVPIPVPVPVYREPHRRMTYAYNERRHYDRYDHRHRHPRHERHRDRYYPGDRY